MVKTFRKLAALTAAVALVSSFAVCASAAVTVNMTTSYVDVDTVAVKAVVSADAGELNGAEVTYYATHNDAAETAIGKVVYMDQKPATNGSATFEFKTDKNYIESTVKVGYTGAPGAVTDEIPDYDYVVVTNEAGTEKARTEIKADLAGPYTVTYTPAEGCYVSALEVENGNGAEAEAVITKQVGTSLEFYLTGIDSVDGNITIKATETQSTSEPTGGFLNAAGIIADGNSDIDVEYGDGDAGDYMAATGNRKITVIGQVQNLAPGAKFGVIVAATINAGDDVIPELPTEGCYAALAKDAEGKFAVQLIDTDEIFVPGQPYETAVYYEVDSGYKIIKGASVKIPVPAAE